MKLVWKWPALSRKAHLFTVGGPDDVRSLCGRWLYTGAACDTQGSLDKRGPDDCTECHKRARRTT